MGADQAPLTNSICYYVFHPSGSTREEQQEEGGRRHGQRRGTHARTHPSHNTSSTHPSTTQHSIHSSRKPAEELPHAPARIYPAGGKTQAPEPAYKELGGCDMDAKLTFPESKTLI